MALIFGRKRAARPMAVTSLAPGMNSFRFQVRRPWAAPTRDQGGTGGHHLNHVSSPDLVAGTNVTDNTADEWIELHNTSEFPGRAVSSGFSNQHLAAQCAVSFMFPPNVTIPARGFALVVGFDLPTAAPRTPSAPGMVCCKPSRFSVLSRGSWTTPGNALIAPAGRAAARRPPDFGLGPLHPGRRIHTRKRRHGLGGRWNRSFLQRSILPTTGNDRSIWLPADPTPALSTWPLASQ